MLATLLVIALAWFAGVMMGYWLRRESRNLRLEQQSTAYNPQNAGELAVMRCLSETFSSKAYHLLNHITLPYGKGTTQIDHILVSRYGIFVLETKHYRGTLLANPQDAHWVQVSRGKHYSLQNPLQQNQKHVQAVQQLLDFIPAEHIHSLIIFTGTATFAQARPKTVLLLNELPPYLRQFRRLVISEYHLQWCVGRLECQRKALTAQTDLEHIRFVKRYYPSAFKTHSA